VNERWLIGPSVKRLSTSSPVSLLSAIGLRTAILREVVHPSVRALGGEARSPAHGGVRWAGALSIARLSTEAKDIDSRSTRFSYPLEVSLEWALLP